MQLPCILYLPTALAFVLCCSTTTIALSNETDVLALLTIKSQLHDPLGVTSLWNTSINLCQWRGVTCGRSHQRVTTLDLANQSISGFLSPYVGNLSFVRYINIGDNSFYGDIPNEVGRLFRLETLVLSNNSFSGTIPNNLSRCSKLTQFFASNNHLVGEVSAVLGHLLKLERLVIGSNKLTGELPASLGNLSALEVIFVRENRLSGKIPNTVGQLRNLVYLHLGINQFSGEVPSSIYNLSSLEMVYLSLNSFDGRLLFDIGANLPNLRDFGIGVNKIFGSIPESLSNASNLEILDLSGNQLKGKVSIDFGRHKNLSTLLLWGNNLGFETDHDLDFVTTLRNCSKLKSLNLADNQFGGELPHSIANLSTTVISIKMGSNKIHGTIPLGIGNLVNLNEFTMEFNQLTGIIPDVIGQLTNLQSLYLNKNWLQGTIPSSLGNLTLLTKLFLGSNNLVGNLPSSLGNCQNLLVLGVYENKLTGAVPPQIFGIITLSLILDLSSNLFSGSLALEVGNLKNLVEFYVSKNQFSGEIPVTLSACTSLEYFDMHGNSFRGTIPLSLSSLKSIKFLDLSSNNLSGQIAMYFENLSFLEHLNLSYNHFEGEVPTTGVFNNKTRISLSGNEKLCGGLNELLLPPCPSKRSRKSKMILLKVLIPVAISCLILSVCLIIVYVRRRGFADKSFDVSLMEQQFPLVSYAKLSDATGEFSSSNMIGQGSFGFVYKGILDENGMMVAVKVINLKQKGASRSFVAECQALRNIRHRNLIKIITICSSIDFKGDDFKALVYEYMQNGNLEKWLHPHNDQHEVCNLSLIQRVNIAIDVASAMEYLHHHCQPQIIHGDLKPSNVLLDQDMVAHMGDFGLAKFLSTSPLDTAVEAPSSSIGIKGTVGYVAPEYGIGSEASVTGDIYSFGIMLLEMFSGKRPTDAMFIEGLTLHDFTKKAVPGKVMEIIDPSLLLDAMASNSTSSGDERVRIEECLVAVFRIGVVCSMESPIDRMDMKDVVTELCAAREIFLGRRI